MYIAAEGEVIHFISSLGIIGRTVTQGNSQSDSLLHARAKPNQSYMYNPSINPVDAETVQPGPPSKTL